MSKTILPLAVAMLACIAVQAAPLTGSPSPKNRVITLEQAYDITLASDQSIRNAYYEIRKANLLPWSALARLGPQLNANASLTNSHVGNDVVNTTTAASSYVQTTNDVRFSGFTYTQPIFDASVFPAYRYGKLTAKAARLQHQFTVRETLFGVAQAYYNVLKQQQLVTVNEQTLELASQQLGTAQARFDAGAVARIDVLRAQATLEDARNTLIQSQGLLETARDTLSNILNLGGKTDFTLAQPPHETAPATPFDEILKRAYACREDYQTSAIGVEQQVALRGEVSAQYAPKLVAQGSTQWASTTGDSTRRNHETAAVLSVQWPIFTGGQREIDLITANHKISQSRLNVEKAAKTVESDVKVSWVHVETGREALKALTAEVEASTQNYKDLQAQYQAGTATSLDAQTALRDLNSARTKLTNQTYDYQIALRDLKRAEATFQQERVEKARIK